MMRMLFLATIMTFAFPAESQATEETGSGDRILVMMRLPVPHFRSAGSYTGGYGDGIGRSQILREARRIARAYHLTLVSDWPMPLINLNCVVMRVPAGASADSMAVDVSRDRRVEWSQPMQDFHTLSERAGHDDPLYPAQPARTLWQLDAVHRLATGRGVTVAVIDSGIDTRHPDLIGKVSVNINFVAGRPLVAERHGTEVAGIIAANADNGIGVVGVAPAARLAGLRACWQTSGTQTAATCDSLSIAKALHYTIEKRLPVINLSLSIAKALHYTIEKRLPVINLSLSGPPDRLLATLLDVGTARGATVVAAFDPARPDGGFPASHPGIIAVAGSAFMGQPRTLYIAPARDIPTTEPGGGWGLVDGTSYAAAHVSGLFALIREPQRHRQGRSVLVRSGGVIDALATVQGKMPGCDDNCPAALAARNRP